MKNLREILLLLILSAGLAVSGCSDDADDKTPDPKPDVTEPDASGEEDSGGTTEDTSEPSEPSDDVQEEEDVSEGEGEDTREEEDVEEGDVHLGEIDTEGAELTGEIAPNQTLNVTLSAEGGDVIVMWFKKAEGSTWNPSLTILKPNSSDSLVFSTPEGGADAHIPYQQDQLDDGWTFYESGEYELELANSNPSQGGAYEFTLECLAGPCKGGSTPPDGENPFAGLSDAELKQAILADHAGHIDVGYDAARDFIFEYNIEENNGKLTCHYTGRQVTVNNRMEGQNQGFDTEHTWPQSLGAGSGPARTDIHHLWPIDAQSNSRRSNYLFDDVVSNVTWSEGGSKLGSNANGETRFEVRDDHKGNVARAYFYFSVIYDMPIEDTSEATLREWHVADPPDESEKDRNDKAEEIQNSRNPFIDYPEIVDQIADF